MSPDREPSPSCNVDGARPRYLLSRWLAFLVFGGAGTLAFRSFTGPIDTPFMRSEVGARLFWPALLAIPAAACLTIVRRDREAGIRMFCAVFFAAAGVLSGGALGSAYAEHRLESAVERAQRAIEADIRAGRTSPTSMTAIAPFTLWGSLDSESGRLSLMLFGKHGPHYEVVWDAHARANEPEGDR